MAVCTYLFAHVDQQVEVMLDFGQREIVTLLVHHVIEMLDARGRFQAA